MSTATEGGKTGAGLKTLRIGTVPYLNVQPLIWAIQRGHLEPGEFGFARAEVEGAVPRELASRLAAGDYHLGLVPAFEYLRNPVYAIALGGAIATRGRVGSVTIFSEQPLERARVIHLDPASLTSVNLTRILAAELKLRVHFDQGPPPAAPGEPLPPGMARLLIGDPAIAESGRHTHQYDLGTLWFELTGLPFVFAAWLVRDGTHAGDAARMLARSRDLGVGNMERVARETAAEFGSTPEFALRYFRENLHFYLGAEEIAGWRRYAELAARHGLIGRAPELRFVGE